MPAEYARRDATRAAPVRIGVLGAGVMGAGIAELGLLAGIETVLCDASAAALERGVERIRADLARSVERGRIDAGRAERALALLRPSTDVADVDGSELVIEAVPEDLALKRDVLSRLPEDVVIATNTSSLPVTAIAAGLARPERVVGMHFFNPPTAMRLVEVVAGAESDPRALALVHATAVAFGKTPIVARDAIGFVVNRCLRPFYTEALRLLDEGVAPHDQIDRICRIGAGFRMGPFEVMDLVGIETNLDVAESFAAQSWGEPRWKPSPSQRVLVTAGRLGRKSGRGWYDYRAGEHRPPDPELPAPAGSFGPLVVHGTGGEADGVRALALDRGVGLGDDPAAADAVVVFDRSLLERLSTDAPILVSCASDTLAASGRRDAVGFHLLPPALDARVLELTCLPGTLLHTRARAEKLAAALGLWPEWVDDAPGLVLGRMVAQLVNEGCFAVGEGIASAGDVDLATTLGLNHPFGPIAWGERLGWATVLDRVDGLHADRHDDRYRAAPLLRRAAASGYSVRELVDPSVPRGAFPPAWTPAAEAGA